MNKKLLSLQVLVIAFSFTSLDKANAQTYYHTLSNYNEWDIYVNMIPVVNKNLFMPFHSGSITTADTIINAVLYKKVYSMTDDSLFSNGKPRFIREDTVAKKVYLLSADSANERLLYDFSMQVGDSTYLEFLYPSPFIFSNGYYFVDSISTINTIAGNRNIFYLTSPVNPTGTFPVLQLEWIESIGSTISPVYLDEDLNNGPPTAIFTNCNKFFLALTCAFADSNQTFHDSCMALFYSSVTSVSGDSCIFNLVGAIDENIFSDLSLQIQPNPLITSATVKIKGDHVISIPSLKLRMIDALGRVQQEYIISNVDFEKGITINKQNLSNGIYFMQLYDKQTLKAVSKIALE